MTSNLMSWLPTWICDDLEKGLNFKFKIATVLLFVKTFEIMDTIRKKNHLTFSSA